MKNIKFDIKNTFAICFTVFIVLTGLLTVVMHPVKIAGGLVRGYIDTPEEESVFRKVGNSFKTFDTRVNEYFAFHDLSVNAYGGIQKLLGKTLIDDPDPSYEVLKLNNDYLTFRATGAMCFDSLGDYLLKLKDTCDKNNVDLLYVNKLSKDTTDPAILPKFYPFAYDNDYEDFDNKMKEYGVSTLDLNVCVEEQKLDKFSLFFKTDHHWLPSSGLWATQRIVEKCNETFDYHLDTDIYNMSNYNIETYERAFLGTQGKRVGYWYTQIDDFDVITPKYDTSIQLDIDSKDIHESGTFEQTMIHREYITPDNLMNMEGTAYQTYMSNNFDLVKIENLNNLEGKTCLYVMDSFGRTVSPFLSQSFKTLYCIDIRQYEESIHNFIEETKPDVVIYMISSHQN